MICPLHDPRMALKGITLTISHLHLVPLLVVSNTHLLKMSIQNSLSQRLGQWVRHIQCGLDSPHLKELLLEVFVYDVKSPLYMLEVLVRPELFSESYGAVVVAV